MSDLATAAAAMGLPEALVERSVHARAAATGASVDDLLTEWSGGDAAPVATPPPAAEDEPAAAPAETPPAPQSTPEAPAEIVVDVPQQPSPASVAAATGPYKPPVLVGARDNPMTVLAGVVGLFFIVVMVAIVGPSIPVDSPGARSSDLPYSEAALEGKGVFQSIGCAACHTQMVRPVVADVGLGAVTLNDSNQVLGARRFGPDLSDVGSRLTSAQLEATVSGLGDHPSLTLGPEDLDDLVSYLSESVTSVASAAEEAES